LTRVHTFQQEQVRNHANWHWRIPLQSGFCESVTLEFSCKPCVIVSLSEYKVVFIVINKSRLAIAAIVQQLYTLNIRQIMLQWLQHCLFVCLLVCSFVCLLLNGTSVLFRLLVPRKDEIKQMRHIINDLKLTSC